MAAVGDRIPWVRGRRSEAWIKGKTFRRLLSGKARRVKYIDGFKRCYQMLSFSFYTYWVKLRGAASEENSKGMIRESLRR